MSYYFTSQSMNEENKYKGTHLRLKLDRELGPGKLTFWTDIAAKTPESEDDDIGNNTANTPESDGDNNPTKYIYVWLDYNWKIFESDFGMVSIKPTIRFLDKKETISSLEHNSSNIKFELTTEIKFK